MPAYDIAARAHLPSELNAIQLANKGKVQENRLLKHSADYEERTGSSEAGRQDRQLDIMEQRNVVDMEAVAQKYAQMYAEMEQHSTENDKRALDAFEKTYLTASSVYDTVLENGGDPEKAVEFASQYMQLTSPQLPNNLRLGTFSPILADAIGERNGKVTRIGQRIVNLPGETPFEAEVWGTEGSDKAYITRGNRRIPITSDQMTTPLTEKTSIPKTVQQAQDHLEASTRKYLASNADALELITRVPDVNTFVARGASIVNNMMAEAKALAGTLTNTGTGSAGSY